MSAPPRGRVLVTGATGFVGTGLVPTLAAAGWQVRAASRNPQAWPHPGIEPAALPDLSAPVDWRPLLAGVETIVHLAAIAHIGPNVPEALYDRVNAQATAELAQAAAGQGARLVFVSSIRAQTGPSATGIVTEATPPAPTDPYGRAKLAGEAAVRAAGGAWTILRPTVVYGPGVRGNVRTLLRLAQKPVPLPFAGLRNRRSMLARDNFCAAILFALENQGALGETFVVADPETLTLAEAFATLQRALHGRERLFAAPEPLLRLAVRALLGADAWDRIAGDLVVDPAKLLAAGWQPPFTARDALAAMARASMMEP